MIPSAGDKDFLLAEMTATEEISRTFLGENVTARHVPRHEQVSKALRLGSTRENVKGVMAAARCNDARRQSLLKRLRCRISNADEGLRLPCAAAAQNNEGIK